MMSEVVLGIDTSTRVCVGLARDGEIIASTSVGDSRSHAELLIPTVQSVMAHHGLSMSDVTGISLGMGPGPFTGLRVGIAAAKVFARTLHIPLYRVCSLDVLGIGWAFTRPQSDFVACTDARRKELYWARYDREGNRISGPFVTSPLELPDLPCVGPGVLAYPDVKMDSYLAVKLGTWVDQFASSWPRLDQVSEILGIDAGILAAYGSQLPDVGSEPLYLRHADAVASTSVKSVLPTKGER
jgi:tRNA threonylcarbamoyl adenosine modification protein YeaZ